jgi:DEAD/DEAH box helicase domain-containing protein
VLATGTASGKSLGYQLPALEALHLDDRSVVLHLSPTKALAHDQLRALRQLRLPWVRAAVLDGDTPREERAAVRRTANWVLTNPDLLHASLLGDHQRWADVLHRCRVVIIDESHVSRGVFGSHVALVLRRLRRLLERYGADPLFLLASATVGNPGEHASALTGLEVTEVVADGAPRGPSQLGLWLPPLEDDGERRRSTLRETAELLAAFVAADVQTLAFTRSRKGAEVIAAIARDRLTDRTDPTGRPLADTIAAYRAGYLAEDRRALEAACATGASGASPPPRPWSSGSTSPGSTRCCSPAGRAPRPPSGNASGGPAGAARRRWPCSSRRRIRSTTTSSCTHVRC